MGLKNSHNPDEELFNEDKLNNEGDLKYFKDELPDNLKKSLWLMYNAFKEIKWVDNIFLSYLINIERNPNELDKFISKTTWFTKNRVLEIINELKIILPNIIENKKIFDHIFNNINNITVKEWVFYKKYFIWKWNFTEITKSIYDFLITKMEANKDVDLDNIYI